MNKIITTGRLVKDPEKRTTGNGTTIVNITIAVQNTKESVTFIDYSLFNKTSENVLKYCKQGDLVLVEGQVNQYKDKNGSYKYGFTGSRVEFLAKNGKREE